MTSPIRHHVRDHDRKGRHVRDYERGSGSKVAKFKGVYKSSDPLRYAKSREYSENFEADYKSKLSEWMEKHGVSDERDVPPEVRREIRKRLSNDPRYVLYRLQLKLKR